MAQIQSCSTSVSRTARILSWTGIAVGAVQLLAPQAVAGALGLQPKPRLKGVMRVLGVREILQSIGRTSRRDSPADLKADMWSRVAGDAVDAVLLTSAAPQTRHPWRFLMTTALVSGITALDIMTATRLNDQPMLSTRQIPR